MAVVIPLIVAYGAAAAGATAAVASMAAIGASLVAGATGVSAKIDKAASKVFGKDAVTAFNIAGAIYGSFGGFSGTSPSGVWDNMGGAFSGAGAAAGGADKATSAAWADPSAKADTLTAMGATDGASVASMQNGIAAEGAMGGDWTGVQYSGPEAQQGAMGGDLEGVQYSRATGPAANTSLPRETAKVADTVVNLKNDEPGALDRFWNSLGDKGKASLIQAGGQVLGGYAQGKMQGEMDDRARADYERRHRPLITVGSGQVGTPGALVSLRRPGILGGT